MYVCICMYYLFIISQFKNTRNYLHILLFLDVAEKVSEVVTNVESMVSAAGTSKPNLTPTEGQSVPESEFNASVKPTAPPRKSNSTPKRRAPAPPPTTSAKAETSAVIHQSEDLQKQVTIFNFLRRRS